MSAKLIGAALGLLACTVLPVAPAGSTDLVGGRLQAKDTPKFQFQSKDCAVSPSTVNPPVDGATLSVTANSTTVTFNLPGGPGCGGLPCWTGDAVKGWKYKNKAAPGAPGQVKTGQIKACKIKVKAFGLGDSGGSFPLPVVSDVTAVLTSGSQTYCAKFPTADATANDPTQYLNKNPLMATCTPGCNPLVPGKPIANTYRLSGVLGPKLCTARAVTNQFGACDTDADCGGRTGTCLQTPWVTADGIAFPFPLGITTTFTVGAADAPPTCEHAACLGCGNPNAPCAGTPGCAGNPQCVTTTCCDQPSFIVPNFLLPGLGLCVRVDQVACGVGVVNSSNPQTGDNEVVKMADTSDPGPDCTYGTGDDPAAKPCDTSAGGAGSDPKGKVVRTIGNGTPDANGIQYRFGVRILATSWTDNQGCMPGATFDAGESLTTQLLLNAELSTAGATAAFTDMNGDGCAFAGAGFTGAGPVTIAPPSVAPVPYAGGTSQAAAAGVALSGSGPLNDIGFVAIVPNGAPTIVTRTQSCTCNPTPGCPE